MVFICIWYHVSHIKNSQALTHESVAININGNNKNDLANEFLMVNKVNNAYVHLKQRSNSPILGHDEQEYKNNLDNVLKVEVVLF